MDSKLLSMSADMLDLAADHYSNHGCNDHYLADTQENRAFVLAMIAASDFPEDEIRFSDGEILVSDTAIMLYCARMLRA